MKQENQGKITIQEGQKTGDELVWGEVAGEKEFQYFGEAKEAADGITWQEAEEICGRPLKASHALLIKSWQGAGQWQVFEERVLLLFVEEEK